MQWRNKCRRFVSFYRNGFSAAQQQLMCRTQLSVARKAGLLRMETYVFGSNAVNQFLVIKIIYLQYTQNDAFLLIHYFNRIKTRSVLFGGR